MLRPIMLFALLIPGCSTTVAQKPFEVKVNLCPPTKLIGPVSQEELTHLQEGCRRVYGPGSCLVRVESFPARQHFNAVCRRADTGQLGRVKP